MKNYSKVLLSSILILSVAQILVFLIYYISNYLFSNIALFYISQYLNLFFTTVMPVLISVNLLFSYLKKSKGRVFRDAAFYALTTLFYYLPYYYLDMFLGGLSTPAAITLALLISLLIALLFYFVYVVLTFIIIGIYNKKTKGMYGKSLIKSLGEREAFDFSEPLALGIFVATVPGFIYNVISELINTVHFLINFAGTFKFGEILYIMFTYLFIIAMLLIVPKIAFSVKRIILTNITE